MLIDRDAYVDATTNKNRFVAEGLQVELRYPSILPQGYEGYWLDPQSDKEFGSNAKYLRFEPAEAKKLLSAAGYANGFQTTFLFEGTGRFGTVYGLLAQVLPEMWAAGGIKASLSPIPYAEYIRYRQFSYAGDAPGFNGIGMHQHSGAPTASLMAYEMLHPAGRLFIGAPQDGRDPLRGDSEVTKLIEEMIGEFDVEKQQRLAKDYQRLLTGCCLSSPRWGST
jgi:ABC-type transport system substrate-binding protein